MKIIVSFFILLFCTIEIQAGTNDSLLTMLNKVHDTKTKSEIYIQLIESEFDGDSTKCIYYIKELESLGTHSDRIELIAKAQQEKGKLYKKKGKFIEAVELFKKAAEMYQNINADIDLAGTYNNIGATYVDAGEYKKSIEYILKSLKIYDRKNNKKLQSKCYHNLGLVFYYQKNYDLALDYYKKALDIRMNLNDSVGMALTMNNIGIIHYYRKNETQALTFFKNALKINEALGKKSAMSMPVFNIAEIYFNQSKHDSAYYYAQWSYEIDTSLHDIASEAKSLVLLAHINKMQKKYTIALEQIHRALKLSEEVGSREDIKDCYQSLAEIYKEMGKYQLAADYYGLTLKSQDSLYSKQNAEIIAELQTRYETEKKDILLEKQEDTIKHQKTISFILTIGIAVTLILLILFFIEYRQKIKAYTVLKIQKKNISDSINYASRIQTALLPPKEVLYDYLPNHFILYMPKDVVSGDFYWLSKTETHLFLAVGDCTGHGVPGAFMSMLGFAYLNEIVNRNPDYAANDILNSLRQKVTHSLHQNSHSISKDGIDMSLAIIDMKSKELQYAGANNPMVICRNHTLTYLHPDKMPIGIHFTETEEPFSLKRFELQKNDTLYFFTDGYVDQYGGEGLKKIGRNNFNNLLLEASTMNIERQKFYLEEHLIDWKKDVEQMDDILVVGIKI